MGPLLRPFAPAPCPTNTFQRTRSMTCSTTGGGVDSDLSAVMSSLRGKAFNPCPQPPPPARSDALSARDALHAIRGELTDSRDPLHD